jgi:hypothetical protein
MEGYTVWTVLGEACNAPTSRLPDMKKLRSLTVLALRTCASAFVLAAPSSCRPTLNGLTSPHTATLVNGTTYVPVGALTRWACGPPPAPQPFSRSTPA